MKAGKRVAAVNLGLRRNAPALTIANMRHRKARIIVPENPSETIKIDCHAGYTPPMGEYVFWNAGPKRCARTMPDRAPVRSREVDMSIRDQQPVHSGFGGKTKVSDNGTELTSNAMLGWRRHAMSSGTISPRASRCRTASWCRSMAGYATSV